MMAAEAKVLVAGLAVLAGLIFYASESLNPIHGRRAYISHRENY